MSELEKINGNKTIIVCFGGKALKMGGIPPFEFVNYLSSLYLNECDLLFFIDKKQCWYHNGIDGLSKNITETIEYLNKKLDGYNKIIFMGTSAGGYASILFGSLCNNIHSVIAFIPQTFLDYPIDPNFKNLNHIINNSTN
jgi:hypothetical protein